MKLKALFLIVLIPILFYNCKKEPEYIPRIIKNISLQKFDHTKFGLKSLPSIRSIELVDSTAFMVGEKGKILAFYPNGNFLITPNDFFGKGKFPNFRSSASSGYNLYALSIESPTELYQIKMDKTNGLSKPKMVYTESYKKSFYNAMAFFDAKNGIAIGDPTDNCLSIIITSDGGNSWGKLSCDNLPKLIEGEAAFAASDTNIAIQGENAWVITGGMQSRVMHTSDMGKTWSIYNTPLINGKSSTGGYSIAFSDAKNGIICGGDYTNKQGNTNNKAITKDGGKTWKIIAQKQTPGYISCVQYVPNSKGQELFAVSTEGIYFSNDGGLTWLQVNKEGYYTIRFVDANNAWLAGNGKVAKLKLN